MPKNPEELHNSPNKDFKIPTEAELLQLEIESQGLGSGATVHAIENILGWLKRDFKKANEKSLWNEKWMQDWWLENTRMLRTEKQKRLEEIAREKGLL